MERVEQAPLAIVGMACRVPGADNLGEFWQLLLDGRSGIVEVPADRLDQALHYDPKRGIRCKTYTKLGGVIQYKPFDALRCPTPSNLLPAAEIGHQTICQVAADACRHAGQNPFDLPLRNAGVYIGHNLGGPVAGDLIYGTRVAETAQYLHEVEAFIRAAGDSANEIIDTVIRRIRDSLPRRGRDGAPQSSVHLGGAIISEAFGLSGPTQVLDAACSSALQGLAMASRALRLGRIDMAIVGGASYFHVDSLMLFSKAQSASAKGSRPFDEQADGLVSGEGYAAIVVKTLERALADGDPIQGVIRGIGVSSDGRGKSLWAPRKEGQVLAMRRAYGTGADIGRLQFIEAHATSTRLGDLTEMKAIAEVLLDHFPAGHRIPIGGVKANVGHTLESAGLIGLIKTLLAMQHATIPQQINLQQLNTGIDWEQAPFYVPTTNASWQASSDGHPRRAAVNSFGIGGLNVHVVVDEHAQEQTATTVSLPAGMASTPVAIIGAGCIFPGARTLDGFWDLLDSGRDAISDVPLDRWDAAEAYDPSSPKPWHSVAKRGGFITDFTYDWRKHKVPPLHVKYADPLQLMILDATDSALADAGYDQKPYDRERVGVVVGTVFGSDFCEHLQMGFCIPDFCRDLAILLRERGVPEEEIAAISEAYADVLLQHMPALLDETGGFTPSTLASRITKTYDLMGGAATIDAGQASSLAAIACAVDALRDGSCDMVICAAGNRAMSLPVFELLSLEGSLDGTDTAAPFDAAAKGYLPGEGVGVLILKRREDAERDGDRIRGVIRGVGAGYDMSRHAAVSQAVERASKVADIRTSDLSFLETSGTGHEADDQQELAAIQGKLDEGPRRSPLKLGTVVGQIGHTQGASGMASLLKAVCSLEKNETIPTVKATTPIACLVQPAPIQLSLSKAPLEHAEDTPGVMGINSTDSAGAAYHLILEGAPHAASKEAERTETGRIVRLGAISREQLGLVLQEALASPSEAWQRAETLRFQPEHRCRVAIVAVGLEDFQARLQAAVQNMGTPKEVLLARQNVFIGETVEGAGKIAFVFAGQGSQYANMLQPLVEEFPAADAIRSQLNDTLQKLGCVSFDEVAWKRGDQLGADVWLTQLSLLCADLILFHSLGSLGVRPDVVAGHSFGEFPALAAAGVWDLENAILGTKARCDAIVSCGDVRGKMLSAAAAGNVLEPLCAEIGGPLYPANYNSPEQTVVGGGEHEIEQLEQRLKQLKIGGKVLPVPRPFHTPLMQPTQEPLRVGLANVHFAAPQLSMVSSVTNELVSSADQARENLIAQMVSPVRYVQLVDQLAHQGVKAIVEVGPRDVLTRLNSKILRDQPIVCIASDDKSRPGVLGLLAVQACLETRGLLDPRKPAEQRPTTPAAKEQPQSQPVTPPDNTRSEIQPLRDGVIQLNGSPRDQGLQHGEVHKASLKGMARRFSDVSGVVTDADFTAVLQPEFDPSAIWTNEERQELEAIAESVGTLPKLIYAWNVWLEGPGLAQATQAAAKSLKGRSVPVHGFDAQVANSGPWSEYAKAWELRLIRPATGLAHVLVAQPGALGSPAGLNELGIAVSALADVAAEQATGTPAVPRSLLVRRVLRQANSLEDAIKILRNSAAGVGSRFLITDTSNNSIATLHVGADGVKVGRDLPLAADVSGRALVAAATSDLPGFLCAGAETADAIRDRFAAVGLLDHATGDAPTSLEQQIETVAQTVESACLVRMLPSSGEVTLRLPGIADDQRSHVRLDLQVATITSPPEVGAEPPSLADTPRIAAFPVDEYLAASQSVDGQPPFDTEGRTCHRFVLRPLHTPKPPIEEILAFRGNALVIGNNDVSQALRAKLAEIGIETAVLPLFSNREKMLAAVEKAWHSHHPVNLIFATGWDKHGIVDLDPENWQRRLERGIVMPFLALQKWFSLLTEAGRVEDATVGATSRMGGDLGLSGHIENLEGGALTGLIKSLGIEVGYATNWHFVSKAVDAPGTEPPEVVAEALLRELRAVSWFAEFGYNRGERYVLGAMPKKAEPVPDSAPTAGKPWLLTGGARGITAAIGLELGKRFGVKLHLIGTSPLPQIDATWRELDADQTRQLRADLTKQALAEKRVPNELWSRAEKAIEMDKTLRDMEAVGIDVTYHCCDVTDRAAVQNVLDRIRQQHGPLEGIIHGAGIENAARLTKKEPEGIERTISSKVSGAAWLMELTQNDPLRYFFGFGSISGRWGSIGQTDYCLASDMLCKLVNWYRKQRPEVRACSFHWQPWDEVGMAARNETRGGGLLDELKLLSPKEGIEHFMAELLAGVPENEVLITDWQYYKRYHPDLKEEDFDKVFIRSSAASAPFETHAEMPVQQHPEIDWENAVATRHVLRPFDLPWEKATRQEFRFSGAAWILGQNQDAVALGERLASEGIPVHHIPIHESIDKTLSELQWLWGQNPGHHLFLMTGRDDTASQIQSPEEWAERRQAGVVLPFLVCQKWIGLISQANHNIQASVVAVTSLGGDWGFTNPVPAPEGGALAGLLKGLWMECRVHEQDNVHLKIIDAPPDEPAASLADAVVREMQYKDIGLEVAFHQGQRTVARLAKRPIALPADQQIERGGNWIFTGGARGITAAVAKELGKRYGLKLQLLGMSPPPQVEEAWLDYDEAQLRVLKREFVTRARQDGQPIGKYWDQVRKDLEIGSTLRELSNAGVKATYHRCDVTDWDQLRITLDKIREVDGPIHGIVHGAGVQGPAISIGETTEEILSELIAVKLDAVMALMQLTKDDPIRYLAGFGSISGRFGSFNAAAYALGSDAMCKLIGWYRGQRPDCAAVGFHWHPWGEVGMMTRPVAQHTIKVFKMNMMSPLEGATHLINEFRGGAPESEVLISDSQFYDAFYSPEMLIDEAITAPQRVAPRGALIDVVEQVDPGRSCAVQIKFDPVQDPFLSEHRLRDKPTLPMVVALEAFAEAGALLVGKERVRGIRDAQIADAVRFFGDDPISVRITADVRPDGVHCLMTSDFRNRRGQLVQKDRPHFSAIVEVGDQSTTTPTRVPDSGDTWFDMTYPERGAVFFHGSPLRLLKRMTINEAGGFGQIEIPLDDKLCGSRSAAGWLTPSAALDACYYACGVFTWCCADQGICVPHSLQRLRLGRQPQKGEQAMVHLVCQELGDKFGQFDITLIGADQSVLLQADGYRCHILRGGTA